MKLVGTVYIIDADGVPRDRHVAQRVDVSRVELPLAVLQDRFRAAVENTLRSGGTSIQPGERLEFGPIGEPWGIR